MIEPELRTPLAKQPIEQGPEYDTQIDSSRPLTGLENGLLRQREERFHGPNAAGQNNSPHGHGQFEPNPPSRSLV